MNKFMNGLREADNYKLTENGGLAHKSSLDAVYDLYALGGAYRKRSDDDCVLLFKNAFEQDETMAMKCLFYLRDILQGQGERRFFRVCFKWLAQTHPDAVIRNLKYVSEFGRWDDIFVLMDTKVEKNVVDLVREQLKVDLQSLEVPNGAVSLLGKWMPSQNASSERTKATANRLRAALGFTSKQYRKILSALRKRINVLECLMSANEWDKIDFSKIPSQAGMKYRKAFQRHAIERKKAGVTTYEDFVKDETTTVNAKALAPYEVVEKAVELFRYNLWHYNSYECDEVERAAVNKYWNNLHDYFNGMPFNGICVVDTSGSMSGTPINVAISLGLYCAERAKGPFANHYISFSSRPQLIKTEGVDFVDKVQRIYSTNLCENTNLEAVFELMLNTAIQANCSQEDLPQTIAVISDMEIDNAQGYYSWDRIPDSKQPRTMMEKMRIKWAQHGYELPHLVYWNVDARSNNFLDDGPDVTYISGFSASTFEQLMTGKTGTDLMEDKLNSKRYEMIH